MNSIRDVIYYPSCLFKQSRCSFNGNNADTDTNPETGKVGVRIHNKLTALILSCFGKISTGWDDDLQQRVYFNKASLENWRDWKNLSSSSELNIEEILLDVKSKNKEKVSQKEPEESHGTSSSHKSYLSEEDQETAALEE